jgi:hypothetical protein
MLVNNPKIFIKKYNIHSMDKRGVGSGVSQFCFFQEKESRFWTVTNKGQHTFSKIKLQLQRNSRQDPT